MNFKAYDILSSLVPGFTLFLILLKVFSLPYDKDLIICYTAMAFLIGYIINTFGSWLEDFFFWTWGGKPSSRLLEGHRVWKIRIYNATQIKATLTQKAVNANPTMDELFSIAMRYANGQKDTRIEDFNTIYAFSRTMLTTVLIGGFIILWHHYFDWRYYVSIIPIIIICWLRCKQRGYYFSKEVLNVYAKMNSL